MYSNWILSLYENSQFSDMSSENPYLNGALWIVWCKLVGSIVTLLTLMENWASLLRKAILFYSVHHFLWGWSIHGLVSDDVETHQDSDISKINHDD